MVTFEQCKMCGCHIRLSDNRCIKCGRLDNIFTQFAAWRLKRKANKPN